MRTTESDEVARLLEAMPAWSDVTSGDEAGLRAVESAVVAMAGRSPTRSSAVSAPSPNALRQVTDSMLPP